MTSAPRATGLEDLREALAALARHQQPRAVDGLVFLPIDRAFSIAGHGPVVTGTLRGASVAVGDSLELLPLQRQVRVRAVQIHGAAVTAAMPGQRVALNLRDIETVELIRGMALAAPEALESSEWLTMSVRAVAGAPPLKNGARLRAILGTHELGRPVALAGSGRARGGRDRICPDPLHPARRGSRERARDIASTLPATDDRRRQSARSRSAARAAQLHSILQRLEDLRDLPAAQMIAAEVVRQAPAGTTLRRLSQLSALARRGVVELIQTLPFVVTRSGLVRAQGRPG